MAKVAKLKSLISTTVKLTVLTLAGIPEVSDDAGSWLGSATGGGVSLSVDVVDLDDADADAETPFLIQFRISIFKLTV